MNTLVSFDKDGYRRRIRVLRRLKGMNQTEFTKFSGIPYKVWNHYEQGYPASRQALWTLREKIPGVSTDWIWFGETNGVEPKLLRRLEQLEREDVRAALAKPARTKRKTKQHNRRKDEPRPNGRPEIG